MYTLQQRTLYWTLTLLIVLGIVGYSLYQARNILQGPTITIAAPQNGTRVFEPEIHITGSTENVSSITLNDRPIFIDETGIFSEVYLLGTGYNVIEFTIEDRFGRTHTELLKLFYHPPLFNLP